MLTCRKCGCSCDPSDLRNGVCDDCRDKEEKENEKSELIGIWLHSKFEQMEMRAEK